MSVNVVPASPNYANQFTHPPYIIHIETHRRQISLRFTHTHAGIKAYATHHAGSTHTSPRGHTVPTILHTHPHTLPPTSAATFGAQAPDPNPSALMFSRVQEETSMLVIPHTTTKRYQHVPRTHSIFYLYSW